MRREKINFNWIKYLIFFVILILFIMLLIFLIKDKTPEDNNIIPADFTNTGMANPASVYCIENNGTLEIRTDEQGGQYGVCISLENKKECEEWAFFRGDCEL